MKDFVSWALKKRLEYPGEHLILYREKYDTGYKEKARAKIQLAQKRKSPFVSTGQIEEIIILPRYHARRYHEIACACA